MYQASQEFMTKLTSKQEKEWEITNNHSFQHKKSIKELANQAYNNSLNKLGNYHK